MTAEYKITLPLQTAETASGDAPEGLRQVEQAMGFIPNMYAAMGNSPAVFSGYSTGCARFRAESGFTPVEYGWCF